MLAQQNAVFGTEMIEMGERTNIIDRSSMRESIKKGLDYIKKEGWLSEKEHKAFIQKTS